MFRNFFFDYFFYRLCQASFSDEDGVRDYPPIIIITLIQSQAVGGIITAIIRSFLDRVVTAPHSKSFAVGGVILTGLILVFNYRKFTGRFDEIAKHFDSESKPDRILKGWLIIFTIIISMVPLYIIGTYF